MEERRTPTPETEIFSGLVGLLKRLEIPYEYLQAEDGKYYAFFEYISPSHADGDTLEEAEGDIIAAIREFVSVTLEEYQNGAGILPVQGLQVLKALTFSDEELKTCLRGRLTEDI